MEKQYFWLKMEKDFIDWLPIKALWEEPNGKEAFACFVAILLKAIDGEGAIPYWGVRDTPEEELALQLNWDKDALSPILQRLCALGLVERREDEWFVPAVTDRIGHETQFAVKKRCQRAKAVSAQPANPKPETVSNEPAEGISEPETPDGDEKSRIGLYQNVTVRHTFLQQFREKYFYADDVVTALSKFKYRRNITDLNDEEMLTRFAEDDHNKYVSRAQGINATQVTHSIGFDPDDFFAAALKRSYGEHYKTG